MTRVGCDRHATKLCATMRLGVLPAIFLSPRAHSAGINANREHQHISTGTAATACRAAIASRCASACRAAACCCCSHARQRFAPAAAGCRRAKAMPRSCRSCSIACSSAASSTAATAADPTCAGAPANAAGSSRASQPGTRGQGACLGGGASAAAVPACACSDRRHMP